MGFVATPLTLGLRPKRWLRPALGAETPARMSGAMPPKITKGALGEIASCPEGRTSRAQSAHKRAVRTRAVDPGERTRRGRPPPPGGK